MDAIDTRAYQSRLEGLWQSAAEQVNQGTSPKPVKITNAGGWSYRETLDVAGEKWHVLYDNRIFKNPKLNPANPEDLKLIKKMLRRVQAASAV